MDIDEAREELALIFNDIKNLRKSFRLFQDKDTADIQGCIGALERAFRDMTRHRVCEVCENVVPLLSLSEPTNVCAAGSNCFAEDREDSRREVL